jgi:ribosomal protein L7/L12
MISESDKLQFIATIANAAINTGVGHEETLTLMRAVLKVTSTSLEPTISELELLSKGFKIKAITNYKHRTQSSLIGAKDIIEQTGLSLGLLYTNDCGLVVSKIERQSNVCQS